MTALTADRNTPRREGILVTDPVAASTVIFAGAMYSLDASGNAVKATGAGKPARAVAESGADNGTGAAGAQFVDGRRGVYRFDNSTTAPLARSAILGLAYIEDDQTVCATVASGIAGTVIDVDEDGVWVDVGGYAISVTAAGG